MSISHFQFKKVKRFFPTLTARDKGYPFVVKEEEVKNAGVYKIHYHRVKEVNLTALSDAKGQTWLKVPNKEELKHPARALAFAMLGNSVCRLELGDEAYPEDRILMSKGGICRISKKMEDILMLVQWDPDEHGRLELLSSTTKHPVYHENMGRVMYCMYHNENGDTAKRNLWVNQKKKLFGALDPEFMFTSLTRPFYLLKHNFKIVNYPIDPKLYPNAEWNHETIWGIKNYPAYVMGIRHVEDYKSLPKVRHLLPWYWDYNNTSYFCERWQKEKRFARDKHFQAFKTQLTGAFKHELADIHIAEESDRHVTHFLFDELLQTDLKNIKQDSDFLEYIKTNYLSVAKACLYEMLIFLEKNPEYAVQNDPILAFKQWVDISEEMIEKFMTVMQTLEITPKYFELNEVRLRTFAHAIRRQDPKALNEVRKIYEEQEMPYHAQCVNDRLMALPVQQTFVEKEEKAENCQGLDVAPMLSLFKPPPSSPADSVKVTLTSRISRNTKP